MSTSSTLLENVFLSGHSQDPNPSITTEPALCLPLSPSWLAFPPLPDLAPVAEQSGPPCHLRMGFLKSPSPAPCPDVSEKRWGLTVTCLCFGPLQEVPPAYVTDFISSAKHFSSAALKAGLSDLFQSRSVCPLVGRVPFPLHQRTLPTLGLL